MKSIVKPSWNIVGNPRQEWHNNREYFIQIANAVIQPWNAIQDPIEESHISFDEPTIGAT